MCIQGHADERGTTEYNLHLGSAVRRALDYMVNRGVSPERVQIISYGEEIPLDRPREKLLSPRTAAQSSSCSSTRKRPGTVSCAVPVEFSVPLAQCAGQRSPGVVPRLWK